MNQEIDMLKQLIEKTIQQLNQQGIDIDVKQIIPS